MPSGKLTARVTTSQIYRGAIPFVLIQLVMVALIIAFPDLVSVDKKTIHEDTPLQIEAPVDENASLGNAPTGGSLMPEPVVPPPEPTAPEVPVTKTK